jgi:hypothetical protein
LVRHACGHRHSRSRNRLNHDRFQSCQRLASSPLPYPEPHRIVAVGEDGPKDPTEHDEISFPNYRDLRARTHVLEDIGIYAGGDAPIRGEGPAEIVQIGQMTDGVFPVLGVEPLLGRVFTRADDLPSALAETCASLEKTFRSAILAGS